MLVLSSLSARVRCWLGFGVGPLTIWIFVALQLWLVSCFGTNVYKWLALHNASSLPFLCFALLELAFWVCVIAFAGFATALFWRDFTSAKSYEEFVVVLVAALTWLPALAWVGFTKETFVLLLFIVPMLVFWCLFHMGLARGHQFWESNRVRHFVGDFSAWDYPARK